MYLFGLDTFGDIPRDDEGMPVSHAEAIRQVVREAVLADEVGVDAIALGGAPQARIFHFHARNGPGGDCHAHQEHSSRFRGNRPFVG